jgi:hydroxyacylglutathione hydrolase
MSEQSLSDPQPLRAAIVPVTPFQQNASILVCTASRKAAIVDPGGDVEKILSALKQVEATPEKILITHGHLDHAGGAAELSETLDIPIEGPHLADKFLMDSIAKDAAGYGIPGLRDATSGRWLVEGDEVSLGHLRFQVFHVPGHSPGHVVFFNQAARFLVAGDTLFQGSIGRTDFPYGDHDLLLSGIKTKLYPLGDDVLVLCGHGNPTDIGTERANNPFVRG